MMSDPTVDETVRSLGDLFRAADLDNAKAVFQFMRLLLDDGEPVSVEKLAASLGISADEGAALAKEISARGGEFDSDGNMVGFGLTLVPTPHRYRAEGREFFVWCADDALIFPVIFDHMAVIRSPDPVLGETIAVTVSPDGIEDLEPASSVVSRVKGLPNVDDVRGTGCSFGHFFANENSAATYADLHREVGLEVVPVSTEFRIGKVFVRRDPTMRGILDGTALAG